MAAQFMLFSIAYKSLLKKQVLFSTWRNIPDTKENTESDCKCYNDATWFTENTTYLSRFRRSLIEFIKLLTTGKRESMPPIRLRFMDNRLR